MRSLLLPFRHVPSLDLDRNHACMLAKEFMRCWPTFIAVPEILHACRYFLLGLVPDHSYEARVSHPASVGRSRAPVRMAPARPQMINNSMRHDPMRVRVQIPARVLISIGDLEAGLR